MNHRHLVTAAAILMVVGGTPALAQQGQQMQHGQGMQGHSMGGGASSREMTQAMEKMNRDMTQGMTGNPDQDFARMMAAHHQGAIDMAKAYLKDGKDRKLRGMAEKVVKDQQGEVAELQEWLQEHSARR